jgi:peptidoglycan/LPS O-acetylase OafA/YrhL
LSGGVKARGFGASEHYMEATADVGKANSPPLRTPAQKPGRLLFLDGLRAVAALAVIAFHVYDQDTSPLHSILRRLPYLFRWLMMRGNQGVEIFFVLSGFVITRSVSRDWVDFRFIGRFALRRSLRLDPPYWAVLSIVLLLKVVLVHHDPSLSWFKGRGFDGFDVISNYLYLQTLLQRKIVLGVSWTLCVELMFYLTYVFLLGIAQRSSMFLHRKKGSNAQSDHVRPDPVVLTLLFGSTFICSAWCWYIWNVGQWGHNGWYMYIGRWHMFFVGALLQWVLGRWVPRQLLTLSLLLIVALELWSNWCGNGIEMGGMVVTLTAMVIFAADVFNRWDRWLSGRFIQQIGRISYSIYLVHLPVCTFVSVTILHLLGQRPLAAAIAVPLCFGMSIAVAQICYLLVEKPSLALSQKVRVHRLEAN